MFVISYDPVEVLSRASQDLDLGLILLSDTDSEFIESLGLLNEDIAAQDEADGIEHDPAEIGAAHPGTFVLDENGTVTERMFHRHYRVRPSGNALLKDLGVETPRSLAGRGSGDELVGIEVWASDDSYEAGQEIRVHVTLRPSTGVHLYGPHVSDPPTALFVEVRTFVAVQVGAPRYPEPEAIEDPFFEYQVRGYTSEVDVAVPLAILDDLGDIQVEVEVRYQACTDALCYPPTSAIRSLWLSGSRR